MHAIAGVMGFLLLTGQLQAQQTDETSEPFKLASSVSTAGQQITSTVYFIQNHAVVFEEDDLTRPDVVFDLANDSWQELSSGEVVTLAAAEEWAEDSHTRTRSTLETMADEDLRRFVTFLLDPKFEIVAEGDELSLRSEFLTYEIQSAPTVPKPQRMQLYRYDRLNAYRKAMVDRQLPPFPQLEVTNQLAARDIFPSRMKLEIKSRQGAVVLTTSTESQSLSAEELSAVEAVIDDGAGND